MTEQVHNPAQQEEPKREQRREFRSYVWDIGLALVLMLVATRAIRAFFRHRQDCEFSGRLSDETGTIEQVRDADEQDERKEQRERKRAQRREFWSYVLGAGLALALTLVPFAMVYRADVPRFSLFIVIGVFALLQMIVHFRFFLRIGFRQKREDLQLILFSTLLLIIMVAGTIWIMASLATRMSMPLHP